jgi:hypothetical protein
MTLTLLEETGDPLEITITSPTPKRAEEYLRRLLARLQQERQDDELRRTHMGDSDLYFGCL